MGDRRKTLLLLLALAVLLGGALFSYGALYREPDVVPLPQVPPPSQPQESFQEGPAEPQKPKAADFTVRDGDGEDVKLSDFFGQTIVLNFWASWCPPCREEMPEFDQVYREMGDNIIFLMIDLVDGTRETQETGNAYIEEQGYAFPVYFDMDAEAAAAYGVYAIPTTVLIDGDGYIVSSTPGRIDGERLRSHIAEAAASKD